MSTLIAVFASSLCHRPPERGTKPHILAKTFKITVLNAKIC